MCSSCFYSVHNNSIIGMPCRTSGLLFKTLCLHYPQCNVATEWHRLDSLPLISLSSPQALYKLYNVAANHRHLYHHAFPGPQVEEVAEEQDKKRDWLDKTTGTSWWWTGGGRGGGEGEEGGGTSSPIRHSFILVLAGAAHQYIHYFKPITDCIMLMYRRSQSISSAGDGCHLSLSPTFFVCENKHLYRYCRRPRHIQPPLSCWFHIRRVSFFPFVCRRQRSIFFKSIARSVNSPPFH